MASAENLEEVRVLEHVKLSGLLDGFTDIFGNPQPATKDYVMEIDVPSMQNDERGVLFRVTGQDQVADAQNNFSQIPFSIVVFSKNNINDSGITRGLAVDINNYLKSNFESGDECIMSIQSFGVTGPFIADDSRRYYEISLLIRFYG